MTFDSLYRWLSSTRPWHKARKQYGPLMLGLAVMLVCLVALGLLMRKEPPQPVASATPAAHQEAETAQQPAANHAEQPQQQEPEAEPPKPAKAETVEQPVGNVEAGRAVPQEPNTEPVAASQPDLPAPQEPSKEPSVPEPADSPSEQEPSVKLEAKAEPKIADFAGTWTVRYKYGERQIVRVYTIDPEGMVFFHEEDRRAKLSTRDGHVLLDFKDGKLERLQMIDSALWVEHFNPATSYPDAAPLIGIAKRREGAAEADKLVDKLSSEVAPDANHTQAVANQKITSALWRKKLRGRINYDPNTHILTLLYDFKNARQLDDFDLQENKPILHDGTLVLSPAQTIRHAVKFSTVTITGTLANKGQGTYLKTTGGVRVTREGNWIGIYNASDGERFHGAGENEANEYTIEIMPKTLRMRLGQGVVGKEVVNPTGWSAGHVELCGGSSGAAFSTLMMKGEVDQEWAEGFLGLPQPPGPKDWLVVFKSSDPSIWNSNVKDESRFAIPLADVPAGIKHLRLTRTDTGEYVVVPVTKGKLDGLDMDGASGYGWNGTCTVQNKLRALGVYSRKDHSTKGSPLDRPGVFFALVAHGAGYSGWGFGHVNFKGDEQQYYGWAGQEIARTSFEIAVKGGSLSPEEEKHLLGK